MFLGSALLCLFWVWLWTKHVHKKVSCTTLIDSHLAISIVDAIVEPVLITVVFEHGIT